MNKYLVLKGRSYDKDRSGRTVDTPEWSFEEINNQVSEEEANIEAQKQGAQYPSDHYFVAQLISKVEIPLPPIKPL